MVVGFNSSKRNLISSALFTSGVSYDILVSLAMDYAPSYCHGGKPQGFPIWLAASWFTSDMYPRHFTCM